MSNKSNNISIKRIVSIALMTAIICVLSPFAVAIPVSPVPVSLATFAIYLTLIILGQCDGTISVIVYVLLGFAGAPVFTGFTGGVGKVLGPTGGYIIGYIFLAMIEGIFVERARITRSYKGSQARPYDENRHNESVGASFMSATILLGMILGTVVLYFFGSLWLSRQANMRLAAAFTVGVLPFIIGDVVKMLVALFLGTKIRKALKKNNLI